VFVTCGLGGGTGTGSAPIVAELAKKVGALTIAVVTLPFTEEGVSRWENARNGLEKLRQNSDTVIVIQNDRLLEVVPDMPLGAAFKAADEILVNAVKGITELITEKGLVNLDFADVRAIMQNGGTAMIGIGESEGAENAQAAVEMAMQNKLLDVDITGAKNALINITGGAQMPLKDAKMVMKMVSSKLDPAAKIIWGTRIDQNLGKAIRVMLIVTSLQEKRETIAAPEEKEKSVQLFRPPLAPAPARKKRILPRPVMLPKEEVYAKNSAPENIALAREAGGGDDTELVALPEPIRHDEAAGKNDSIPSTPERNILPAKPRRRLETVTPDKPVSQRVETVERTGIHDDVARLKYGATSAPPESKLTPLPAAAPVEKPARRVEAKGDTAPSPTNNAPSHERQNPDRRLEHARQEYFESSPVIESVVTNGATKAANEANEKLERVAPRSAAPSGKAGVYSKIFAEQSQVHLQIIRESISRLYTDPTRQETLQRIKHAAIAVNNLAKRFVFDVIAAYAATIEEICERVLDGEINMSKKLINAFTEMPAIFESLVNDDDDALIEARRHQERLQRLADSFIDGEVVNVEMNNRPNAPATTPRPPAVVLPRTTPSPRAALKNSPPLERHPRPATEVMDYLDEFLANRKKSPGR